VYELDDLGLCERLVEAREDEREQDEGGYDDDEEEVLLRDRGGLAQGGMWNVGEEGE
jgi:hypothetical protein